MPHGGIPVGRICEINGLESSGKSLIGSHILAECQKKGGIAVYIDTESAVSRQFLNAIGVNTQEMVYVPAETMEDVFETIEDIISKVREGDSDRLVAILVDSVAGASTKVEMEQDFDKEGWATAKAVIMSKAMRKITNLISKEKIAIVFTNQLRDKLGAMFGDKYTTSGGKALPFHSSVRIRLSNLGRIKKSEEIVGMKTKCQITKNRLGPPLRNAEFHMYFDSGIDDYASWLVVLKDYKLCKKEKNSYVVDFNEKEIKFTPAKFKETLAENDGLEEHIYGLICGALIMEYKTSDVVHDESEIEIVDE